MPIYDLGIQERLKLNRLPEIGRLRKGAEHVEGQAPQEIDHFRFTASEDDGTLVQEFNQLFGSAPKVIPVLMALPTTDETFTTWHEEYNYGGFVRMCDGHHIAKQVNPQNNGEVDSWTELPASERPACLKSQGGCQCKPRGVLYMIIPQLNRLGMVVLSTTSKTDIFAILESLNYLEKLAVENGGTLRQIPMQLVRYPKEVKVSYTDKGGAQRKTKKVFYFVRVEAHPNWVKQHFNKIYAGITAGDLTPQIESTPAPALTAPTAQAPEALPPATSTEQVLNPAPAGVQAEAVTPVQTVQKPPADQRPPNVDSSRLLEFFQGVGMIGENILYQRIVAKIILKKDIPQFWMNLFTQEEIDKVLAEAQVLRTLEVTDVIHAFLDEIVEALKSKTVTLEEFDLQSATYLKDQEIKAAQSVKPESPAPAPEQAEIEVEPELTKPNVKAINPDDDMPF